MDTNVAKIDGKGRKINRFNQEIIECKWCGGPTVMLGTKMCDRCWELDSRIKWDMKLARKILEHYEEESDDGE